MIEGATTAAPAVSFNGGASWSTIYNQHRRSF